MGGEEVRKIAPWLGWILAAIGTSFSVGFAARSNWSELPRRVAAIELRQDQTDKHLRFVVCSIRATNNGLDPTQCDVLLVELPDMLGPSKAAQ